MRSTTPSRFTGRPAKRLTVLITVRAHVHHASLEVELLKRARRANLAGASVFEANEGFGHSRKMHRNHLLSDDRPLAVIFIDEPEAIDAYLDDISPLLQNVVAFVEEIEVLDL